MNDEFLKYDTRLKSTSSKKQKEQLEIRVKRAHLSSQFEA